MRGGITKPMSFGRWFPLIPHPVQLALIADDVRFKLVPAGRRSGKTERAKRFVVREAMKTPGHYFVAAPTRDQVKRIYWQDLKLLSLVPVFKIEPAEADLIIYYPNGSTLSLIGLDQPQRMEGPHWAGGIIDEIADVRSSAWAENIGPALDTVDPRRPGYRAWCWLIGVPDGLNHYYDMVEYARTSGDRDWRVYTWKSSEILPVEVIEAAKRRMSPRHYRQEYEASFETASGRIYDDYSDENTTAETIEPGESLKWCHDFNFTPMSSVICVVRGRAVYALDEIVLQSATSRQAALEFVERFKYHGNKAVMLYGDPAGKAGEKHGHASDYTEMEQVLRAHGWHVQRRVKAAAPAIRDRQNAVRALALAATGDRRLFVNPATAPYMHKGLMTVQVKPGSTFQEQDSEYQHITTALGYYIEYEWPIRRDPPVRSVSPVPVRSYYQ
jgi:Terminase large subunit, T4likevirus-type, N-terminal